MSPLLRRLTLVPAIINWSVWWFMVTLVGSQFLCIFWDTTSTSSIVSFGASLADGEMPLAGFNDEPYADRAIVCLTQGRTYIPEQLTKVLADDKLAPVVDTSGTSVSGIRLVKRYKEMKLQPEIADVYVRACERIDYTLEAIQNGCQTMGYNVTRDALRIVVGIDGNTTREITRALPVLLLPFFDNGAFAAYMIPTHDGSLCAFGLSGLYQSPALTYGVLRAPPKQNRDKMLPRWLHRPGGTWRNGWYETLDGQRWYSSSMTSGGDSAYGIEVMQYDTLRRELFTCNASTPSSGRCEPMLQIEKWGTQLTRTTQQTQMDLVFATNGSRFGLYRYSATGSVRTKNYYSLEMLISNASDFVILARWFVSMSAMLYSYYHGVSAWDTTGIGSISSSRVFNLLPLTLLPKLKLTLCAFFTVGCHFEGAQSALASAWYIIYPAIIEFTLLYYSLLNSIAKCTYRRMSDVLFGPTLICLCALHHFRIDIATSSWAGINKRVNTVFLASEVDALKLIDFLTTDVAMRLNGNIKSVFYIKLALLGVNLIPLLLSENVSERRGKKARAFPPCEIEHVLALRASNLGGLGRSEIYAKRDIVAARIRLSITESLVPRASSRDASMKNIAFTPSHTDLLQALAVTTQSQVKPADVPSQEKVSQVADARHVLIGYEMNRLGYLVYGGKFLLSFDDWYVLTSLAPLRWVEKLWNHRIAVFDVARESDGTYRVLGTPHLCRLDDAKLRSIPFYQVTVCAFQ